MRLLLVTNDYPPKAGGIQQYLGNLVERYGDEVRVLAPRDKDAGDDPRVRRSKWRFMWPTPRVRRCVSAQAAEFEPDFVLFGEDPTGSLDALDTIQGVVRDGRLYTRRALDEQLRAYRDHAAGPLYDAITTFLVRRALAAVLGS